MSEKYKYEASVVIPAYNAARFITTQLEALAKQTTTRSFEVVVSDNGSTDNTIALVEAFDAPYPLRWVDSSDIKGPANARNVGAREARGKILVYCDADDFVEPEWVEGHLHLQDLHGPAIGAGANLHGSNPPEVLEAYGIPADADKDILENRGLIESIDKLTPFAGFLPSLTGCNFSVPREVYLEHGGMDCSYIAGSEETDFSWRLTLAGVPFYKTQESLVNYRLRATLRGLLRQQRRYQIYRVLLWQRFKDQGMRGPSLKFSVLAALKAIPMVCFSQSQRAKGLAQLGGNLGALEGIFKYRFRGVPERQLMSDR